ncbi:MAG: putative aminohydrolase SsnA [Lachnospiraceae bacterium]|nr:putative aminohydrolase SsnA [Candidatus Equihabitans merdae]
MLLVGNGKLFTRDAKNPYISDGAVVISGKKIKEVGTLADMKAKYPKAEFVDAHGGVIMPAFINMHEHIYSEMARGLSIKGYNPNGFLDILDGQWWTIDRHLTLENDKYSAYSAYINLIKNGVTTSFDHHASFGHIPDSLFTLGEVAKELGVRTCLCYEISDRDGKKKAKESVDENIAWAKYALEDDSDMLAGMIGMHAQFTISDETFEYAAANKPEEVGYHIHVAEGIEDLHDCLKKYNKRIVDRLYDQNILGPKTLLGHCIYINEHEMQLIKDTDTMIVHNPESNMGNACGCPPTMAQFHHGILVGLGTDGYTHDMTESFKVANVLHKHNLCDANAAWGEVPTMLFENNAKMANRYFKSKLGVLKKGAAADVIVMNYNPQTELNETNLNGHILFGMQGHDCRTTICNGKVLMKDWELLCCDEEKIMAEVRQSSAKLWKSING